jgi:hypothetical protein
VSEKEANISLPFMRSEMAYAADTISETIHILYNLKSPDEDKIIKIRNNLLEILMIIYADEAIFIGSQQRQAEAAEEDSTIH